MTEVDRVTFAEGLFTLGETFNEPMSDAKVEAYFSALEDCDIQQVSGAMRHAIRASKFFPRPADLREYIDGDRQALADAAWGTLLREIRRVGYMGTPNLEPAVVRAVNELWGSWRHLCETLPGEGPELVGWLKQFKQVYESGARDAQRHLTMADLNPNVRSFIEQQRKRLR